MALIHHLLCKASTNHTYLSSIPFSSVTADSAALLLLELPYTPGWPQAQPTLGNLQNVIILKDGESFRVF